MKGPDHNFHYSHLLPAKPGVLIKDEIRTHTCSCGAVFQTKSRIRERCDACRAARQAVTQEKANARTKARRQAARKK